MEELYKDPRWEVFQREYKARMEAIDRLCGGSAANFSVNIYMVIVYRNPKFEDNSVMSYFYLQF